MADKTPQQTWKEYLLFWVNYILLSLELWWMRFNRNLMQDWNAPGKKICVIGDGIAEGYGDIVFPFQTPGLTSSLELYLNQLKTKTKWNVFNCGLFHTTSADWQPDNKNKIFDMFLKKHSDVDIVLVHLGHDDIDFIEPEQTLIHLKRIANELVSKEILVYISMVLVPPTRDAERKITPPNNIEKYIQLNNLLSNWLDNEENKNIRKGPELNSFEYHWRKDSYCSEFYANLLPCTSKRYYLSWEGYTRLSEEWKDILQPTLMKMEFA